MSATITTPSAAIMATTICVLLLRRSLSFFGPGLPGCPGQLLVSATTTNDSWHYKIIGLIVLIGTYDVGTSCGEHRDGCLSTIRTWRGGVSWGRFGFGVEDFADLLRGAQDALADEVTEAGDVLQAGGGRAVAAEDADALPCGLGDLGDAAGTGDRRLVPDVVVDEVAIAAAFVAFPADEAQIFEERDRLGDGRRADLEVLGEF